MGAAAVAEAKMADDDFTTDQGTDYNDKVHRLVAQVAQMFGGQVPSGAFGGSPQGSPGIQMMPGGGAPMGRPPVPGVNPAVPPGPMDYMGQPSSRAPMETAVGPSTEYHTPTPAWQLPQPGGGQPGPANPNPGQPFASYRVGDQPWMVQPITGRGGTSMTSAPMPADQYAAQAKQKPQQEADMGPSAADTFNAKSTEPPNLPRPTVQDAQKWLMKIKPGINTAGIQQDLPKALDYLTKQWRLDQKEAEGQFKDRMSIAREQRLHQLSDARVQAIGSQIDLAQKRYDLAVKRGDMEGQKMALSELSQHQRERKTAIGGQLMLMQLDPTDTAGRARLMKELQGMDEEAQGAPKQAAKGKKLEGADLAAAQAIIKKDPSQREAVIKHAQDKGYDTSGL